jgi:membrane protein DedA with SNARE-associated domain
MFRRLTDRFPHLFARPAVSTPKQRSGSLSARRLGMLGMVLLVSVAISLNQERLSNLAAFGYLGAFLVMLLSNATLILPAPGLIFVFALGSSLHPLLVGLAAGVGATLGELTGYLAGYSGVGIAENSAVVARVQMWMERRGLWTIFFLSFIPNPLFDVAGILAGASRIPVWHFLGVSVVGKIMQSTAIALAGSLSLSWVHKLLS